MIISPLHIRTYVWLNYRVLVEKNQVTDAGKILSHPK